MPSSNKGTPVPAKKSEKADISTPAKHQAAHDKMDAALHKMKMEHIELRRAKHCPK
jgi:hypothetical protein